jgi:STE24 endopeptidase
VSLAEDLFGREQVEKARRYHRPGYVAWVANAAIGLAVLALLTAFGPSFCSLPWWLATGTITAIAISATTAARLPLGYALGHRRERRWAFSTQTSAAWLTDRAKALAIGLALTVPLMIGLIGLARALPDSWPLWAALGAAAVVLLVSFLAPVVIEPVFNRFAPLADESLEHELRALADRAGVPVRDVLVADASRRTTKVNAYVSGVGRTRRVVLFDTLLREASPAETKLVVAHELGHRKGRHVVAGTILAMAGSVVSVLVVWGIVGTPEPDDIPLVLLIGSVLELMALPAMAAISRSWERYADRFALDVTGDAEAFESTFLTLGVKNLSDLDPPSALYFLLFSHPTIPERIAYGRRWARQYGSPA